MCPVNTVKNKGDEDMNIMTVMGTRPEMIRLSIIISMLDKYATRHVLVHTGQNFTRSLSELFFKEMEIRKPDYLLQHDGKMTLGGQIGSLFPQMEKIFLAEKPDRLLVLGDTNSALCAILAQRMGIPVIHMEAGNRCFDRTVPEENNRRIIDAISTVHMPYTEQSKQHLLREGVPSNTIVCIGNPIYEVMQYYKPKIDASAIMDHLHLQSGKYVLVTVHRAENVDDPQHLQQIMSSLNLIANQYPFRIICSTHPRTRIRMEQHVTFPMDDRVEFHEPFGFFDFVMLERHAWCVLTDSGTVQEECCILGVPAVTIRLTTERPETVDCGSNIVAGVDAHHIANAVKIMTSLSNKWKCPAGYQTTDVSDKVVKYVLGANL